MANKKTSNQQRKRPECHTPDLTITLASIGLTIPVVAIVAIAMDWPLELGLDAKSITLLVLSLFVVSNSLRTGRTTSLPGVVHLVIFAAYLFFSFAP